MPKNKTSEWSVNENSNSDIGGTNIAEGCSPAGINNAVRKVMSQIATARTGSDDGIVTGTPGADGTTAVWSTGGDLVAGTATIPANAVGTVQIADDAVTLAKITDAALSGNDPTLITGTAGANGRLSEFDNVGNIVQGPAYGTSGASVLVQTNASGQLPPLDGSLLTGAGSRWEDVETLTMTGTSVATADFATGFDYRFILSGVSHDGPSARSLAVEFFGETAAAYTAKVNFTDALQSTNFEFGEFVLLSPRQSLQTHTLRGASFRTSLDNTNDQVEDLTPGRFGAVANYATAQGVLRLRFSLSDTGSFDSGVITIQRRAS